MGKPVSFQPARRSRGAIALALAALLLGLLGPGAASAETYEVRRGDSLWGIARKFDVTVKAIQKANDLGRSTKIEEGQKLRIPNGKTDSGRKKTRAEKRRERERKETPWWLRKPAPWTQTQKSVKERGGVNPCMTENPGDGVYTRWSSEPPHGVMIMPQRGGITRGGSFDVMFHFHGHEPVRKEWVRVMNGPVLVGVDLGIGSGPYSSVYSNPHEFKRLLESVEKAMAKHTGHDKAHIRKIGLSAWSAGYGAVGAILRHDWALKKVDSVVLLDGLHAGYKDGKPNADQLEIFVKFARLASRGQKFMFVSHSSIIPPGYASTTEGTSHLIHELGGKPRDSRRNDLMGLELIRRYDRGNFHVRGYMGNDKMDHCAHIGLFRDVLKVHINRRWRSPRGRKG